MFISVGAKQHFEEHDFDVKSYISFAVSLARNRNYRDEGAMCLLAQATLYKFAALQEVRYL